jgi:hypothetical protein
MGFFSALPFLSKSATEVFPLFLCRQELIQEIMAFVLSHQLVSYHLRMLRAEAINSSLKSLPLRGKLRGQRPRSNPLSEGGHLTPKTTFKNRARKMIHLQALITLTYFSYCTTKPTTPAVAAVQVISPPAQNLVHGSSEAAVAPFVACSIAATTGLADDTGGTTAGWPDSAPTSHSSQKHGPTKKQVNSLEGGSPVWVSNIATPPTK